MNDNHRIFEELYTGRRYATTEDEGYFAQLIRTRLAPIGALPKGSRILDLGCGNGSFMIPLIESGHDVVGLDYSPAILDEFRGLWKERRNGLPLPQLIEGDARDLPFEDSSFDAVLSFAVLYTISELDQVFSEIRRVLRPGGIAYVDLGNSQSLNDLEARRIESKIAMNHLRPEGMQAMIDRAGLQLTDERIFQVFPLWGGATERDRDELTPQLLQRLGRVSRGRLLDELVSSSPITREYGFRYVMTMVNPSPEEALIGFAQPEFKLEEARRWFDQPRVEARERAQAFADRGRVKEAVHLLCNLIEADPGDFASVVQIAELYEGEQEQKFAAEMRARLDSIRQDLGLVRPTPGVWQDKVEHGDGADTWENSGIEDTVGTRKPAPPGGGKRIVTPSRPLVSVVLPTYNQCQYLPRAIRSLMTQTYDHFEIIIVNDGSTDATAAFLETLQDDRIKIIHQENQRLPSALNRGFAEAQGELYTWVSSDNIAAPQFIARLVEALQTYPDAGFAASNFAWIDESDHILRVTQDQDLSYRSLLTLNPGIAAFMYRAELAQKVGIYDPSLEGAEDWDMWIRLVEQAPAVQVSETLYFYREHSESMTATMSDAVREASQAVVERALERRGQELELGELYPALAECKDRDASIAEACLDFGNRLLHSPFTPPHLARVFYEQALEVSPQALAAAANRCVALAVEGRWDEAVAEGRKLAQTEDPQLEDLFESLLQAAATRTPQALSTLPLFELLSDAPVFQLENRRIIKPTSISV